MRERVKLISFLYAVVLIVPLTKAYAASGGEYITISPATAMTLQGGLRAWTLQAIEDLAPGPDDEVSAVVELDQVPYTLVLHPYSLRSELFTVEAQVEGGELVEVEAPPPATYRGKVLGVPGSRVAASIVDGKLDAAVARGDKTWFVEPLARSEGTADPAE